jgi:hypothetical protein
LLAAPLHWTISLDSSPDWLWKDIKFLDKESSSRLLDLSPDILGGLKEKHPPANEIK